MAYGKYHGGRIRWNRFRNYPYPSSKDLIGSGFNHFGVRPFRNQPAAVLLVRAQRFEIQLGSSTKIHVSGLRERLNQNRWNPNWLNSSQLVQINPTAFKNCCIQNRANRKPVESEFARMRTVESKEIELAAHRAKTDHSGQPRMDWGAYQT